jgi:hypothetical protein
MVNTTSNDNLNTTTPEIEFGADSEAGMRGRIEEGRATRNVEERTAQVPSMGYLALAVGSMAASAAFFAMRKKEVSHFIGQWAPSLLIIGVYNKLVKIENELGLIRR